MQVSASLNNLRLSPRKVRAVSRVIKGMDANRAKYQLDHFVRRPSKPLSKLLDSAISNAYKNFGLSKDNLFVKEIVVNEGPKLKRWRPKGFGSASPIQKKTSNIRIVLDERVPGLKVTKATSDKRQATRARQEIIRPAEGGIEKEPKVQLEKVKPEVKKEIGKKGVFVGIKSLGKRVFRRKAI